MDVRVTLEHDHSRVPEKQFSCSIRLSVRGPDLFAEDVENDLYAAIDLVTKKIEQQFRKRNSKRKATKHRLAARTKINGRNPPNDMAIGWREAARSNRKYFCRSAR